MFGFDDPWVKARIRYVTDRIRHSGLSSEPVEQTIGLFLCMAPRSGSTFLGAVLRDNGIGEFEERFRVVKNSLETDIAEAGAETYEAYVQYKIAHSRWGDAAGFKFDWAQFAPLYYLGAWKKYFSQSYFIYLTREDMLAQAISRYIGQSTGVFHSTHLDEGKSLPQEMLLDYEKVEGHLKYLVGMMGSWEKFFAVENIKPLRLTYERMVGDLEGTLRSIADFTGRPLPRELAMVNEYRSISSDLNERLKAEFLSEYGSRLQAAAQP